MPSNASAKYAVSPEDDERNLKSSVHSKSKSKSNKAYSSSLRCDQDFKQKDRTGVKALAQQAIHIVQEFTKSSKQAAAPKDSSSAMLGRHSIGRNASPSCSSRRTAPSLDDLPNLEDFCCSPSSKRQASQKSMATATTASISCASSVTAAPKQPQRVKSGSLDALFLLGPHIVTAGNGETRMNHPASAPAPVQAINKITCTSDPDPVYAPFDDDDLDDESAEEKWVALNDEKPKSRDRRRINRIVRNFSDSELSEASTIDSCGKNNNGRTKPKAKREDRKAAKNAMKQQALEQQHAQVELLSGVTAQQPSAVVPEPKSVQLDEDDDLIDTDKDLPMLTESIRSMRRKSKERGRRRSSGNKSKSKERRRSGSRRQRSQSGGRRSNSKQGRRGKKKEDASSPEKTTSSDAFATTTSAMASTPARRGGKRGDVLRSSDPSDHRQERQDIKRANSREFAHRNSRGGGRRPSSNSNQNMDQSEHTDDSSSLIAGYPLKRSNSESDARKAARNRSGWNRLLEHSQNDSLPMASPKPAVRSTDDNSGSNSKQLLTQDSLSSSLAKASMSSPLPKASMSSSSTFSLSRVSLVSESSFHFDDDIIINASGSIAPAPPPPLPPPPVDEEEEEEMMSPERQRRKGKKKQPGPMVEKALSSRTLGKVDARLDGIINAQYNQRSGTAVKSRSMGKNSNLRSHPSPVKSRSMESQSDHQSSSQSRKRSSKDRSNATPTKSRSNNNF